MKLKRIEVIHNDLQLLADLLTENLEKEYAKVTEDMIVIGAETYRLVSNSAQWVMVILKKEGESVEIDLIDTDHGTALFNFRWKESKFIGSTLKHFKHQCELKGWKINELS